MMEARLLDRLAGWLIRAAEEIEHFNKSGFNIYLQVNTGEEKKKTEWDHCRGGVC